MSFGYGDEVDGVAFIEVGLNVFCDVGEEAFTVFVEIHDDIGLQKIFRDYRRFFFPFIGEGAGIHKEVYVVISKFFYLFYCLEVTEVEVGGSAEEEAEEFFSSWVGGDLDSSHNVEMFGRPPALF